MRLPPIPIASIPNDVFSSLLFPNNDLKLPLLLLGPGQNGQIPQQDPRSQRGRSCLEPERQVPILRHHQSGFQIAKPTGLPGAWRQEHQAQPATASGRIEGGWARQSRQAYAASAGLLII